MNGRDIELQVAENTANIASLTTDIRGLTDAVHEQGTQIQGLATTMERVAAPRRTDWPSLISVAVTVILMFVTIGGLVLLPIMRELNEVKAEFHEHTALTLHPVGAEKIDTLEARLQVITKDGSPITQNRLVLLEEKVKVLEARAKQ